MFNLKRYWSYCIGFDMYVHVINSRAKNVTMALKVKVHSHDANAVKSFSEFRLILSQLWYIASIWHAHLHKQPFLTKYEHDLQGKRSTREGFLRTNIVVVSFFSKLCYTPIFLIHIFPIIEIIQACMNIFSIYIYASSSEEHTLSFQLHRLI